MIPVFTDEPTASPRPSREVHFSRPVLRDRIRLQLLNREIDADAIDPLVAIATQAVESAFDMGPFEGRVAPCDAEPAYPPGIHPPGSFGEYPVGRPVPVVGGNADPGTILSLPTERPEGEGHRGYYITAGRVTRLLDLLSPHRIDGEGVVETCERLLAGLVAPSDTPPDPSGESAEEGRPHRRSWRMGTGPNGQTAVAPCDAADADPADAAFRMLRDDPGPERRTIDMDLVVDRCGTAVIEGTLEPVVLIRQVRGWINGQAIHGPTRTLRLDIWRDSAVANSSLAEIDWPPSSRSAGVPDPDPGEVYRHYRGGLYEVVGSVFLRSLADDLALDWCPGVAYRSMDDDRTWVRSLADWGATVRLESGVPVRRFTRLPVVPPALPSTPGPAAPSAPDLFAPPSETCDGEIGTRWADVCRRLDSAASPGATPVEVTYDPGSAAELAAYLNAPQPPPAESDRPAAFDQVAEILAARRDRYEPGTERRVLAELLLGVFAERDRIGLAKYGTRLRPGNGRDADIDAFQEQLDRVVYLSNAHDERPTTRNRMRLNEAVRIARDDLQLLTDPESEDRLAAGLAAWRSARPAPSESHRATHQAPDWFRDALDFNLAMRLGSMALPGDPGKAARDMVLSNLRGEIEELRRAFGFFDYGTTVGEAAETKVAEVADTFVDLIYFLLSACALFGIDPRPIWPVVHAANMAKRGGPKDPVTGKQLKPPGWTHPDIGAVLALQAPLPVIAAPVPDPSGA